jgi:6-pyruvoyltetrahydropterin/6-carboxytetrahydropterin synthase
MVVDFGVIKEKVGGWINANWDHNMIMHPEDPLLKTEGVIGRDPFIMPDGMNPTAENMAEILFREVEYIMNFWRIDVRVLNVTLYETPNCRASYGVHSGGKSTEAGESGQS